MGAAAEHLYAIKREDGLWYMGTTDKAPVFGERKRLRAQFGEEFADQRISGLRRAGYTVEKVLVR